MRLFNRKTRGRLSKSRFPANFSNSSPLRVWPPRLELTVAAFLSPLASCPRLLPSPLALAQPGASRVTLSSLPLSAQTEVKFKSVPTCCEGYAVQELVGNGGGADAKCVPQCKKCRSGVCTAPNECTCDPGYQGQECAYGE
jgi:hypothetical protein